TLRGLLVLLREQARLLPAYPRMPRGLGQGPAARGMKTDAKEHTIMQRIPRGGVWLIIATALMFAGCVYVPSGPNVMAMPGHGKSFDQFQYDDDDCRGYAASRVHPEARHANDRAVGSAAVGTVVGAATGAAIGAAAGDPAMGAAVGAGVGLLGGS